MSIDYNELLKGNEEKVVICREVALKQQKEGISDSEILKDIVKFLADQKELERSTKIQKLNTQVAEGIQGLFILDQWSNLNQIAIHALSSCIDAMEKKDQYKTFIPNIKIKKAVMEIGSSNFHKIFKESFLKKYKGE